MSAAKIWIVTSISLARLCAALLFASLAFQDVSLILISGFYALAMVSDLIDGYLARRLKAETYFGKVLDLVSDKSLTIVSLLYAAACGINILPLALIAAREIITIGARMIVVQGIELFPTSRAISGWIVLVLWCNTLFLVLINRDVNLIRIVNKIYWVCMVGSVLTLAARVYASRQRIKISLTEDL